MTDSRLVGCVFGLKRDHEFDDGFVTASCTMMTSKSMALSPLMSGLTCESRPAGHGFRVSPVLSNNEDNTLTQVLDLLRGLRCVFLELTNSTGTRETFTA